MKTKVKKLISGILSVTLLSTTLTYFPAIAEDTGKYPYTMFAGSSEEGAITINASNVCINGNIATNGTIVSSGNMNVNGSKTETAAEEMLYFFNKLDYAYFNSSNVEIHTEDYSYEDTNININVPLEVEGELELTGNINLSTGIKALEDVNLNGEVKNTNESVICSETGDIIINTTNVNLNGLVYAPEGCVDITAQNLNMNNVIIIADTIKVECPNLNANYSNSMGEFIGTESEVDLELFAYGEYISESNSINVFWNTTVPKGTFDVQISYDNEAYTSVGTVTDVESYSYAISEEFEKMYIKVTETTNYGESYDAVPFVVCKAEEGYTVDFLDSDEDDLPDIFEIEIGTNIDISDSDEDGLTDYQEVYFTDTDPTVYDSVTEGIRDADIDSDGDGLSNIFELENEIDPLLEDTDDDGLSDYDEIYVYGTNPAIPDTDEDNIEDGAEIKLGLDPNNPETFGVPDAEYSIEQQIEADSPVMSEVNTEENPYEFSLELKTNGYAEDNLIVSRSGYATAIENEAMLGISTDVEIDSSCNPENIVLKYTIKNEYLDNTLGIYTDCEEFQGIKRLNVFKYFEDINMLLPIETQFDADNNLVYAEVDELGTYCLMDMEIWLNSLGVEPAAEEVNIDLSDIELNYDNDISLLASYSEEYKFNGNKYLICNQRGSWTNCQEACVNSGGHLLTIDSQEEQDFIMSILDEDCRPFYWLGGRKINDNWQWVTNEPFVYSNFASVKPEGELSGDCLRIYGRDMGGVAKGEWSDTVDYCAIVTSDYSEYYGGFICEWEGTPSDEENDDNNSGNESDGAEDNTENEGVTYECLVATKWKTIKLKDVLNASNGVNSDTDSLTDWQEVNTKLLKWNDDGTFELPTFKEIFTVADIALNFQRYYGTVYEIPINNVFYREVLPVISDPTMRDSDGDGLDDNEELDAGTKPCSSDTDNDEISDGDDIYPLKKYKFKNLYFWDYASYNIDLDKWESAPGFVNFESINEISAILYRFYKNIDIESASNLGYINNQSQAPVSDMRYGTKYTMSHNGCELIAVYNALKLKNNHQLLSEIALEFEINGAMLMTTELLNTYPSFSDIPPTQLGIDLKSGYLGSNPFFIQGYLDAHKYKNEQTNSLDELQSWVKPGRVFIISYWNNSYDITSGIHTIAVNVNYDGTLIAYNKANQNQFNDFNELISQNDRAFITGYYLY